MKSLLSTVPNIRMQAAAHCHHQPLAVPGPTRTVNKAVGVAVRSHPGTVTVNVMENADIPCSEHSQDSTFWVPHAALGKDRGGFSNLAGRRHQPFAGLCSTGAQLPHSDMLLVLDGEQGGHVSCTRWGPGYPIYVFEMSDDL